jgi:CHAD domain-containing protein
MHETLERELKLEAPPTFSLARLQAQLDGYMTSPLSWRRLHTIYFDTDDLRLTRWGLSLRFRLHEGWTLKIPVPHESHALYREEHVFEGTPDQVPAGALDLAAAYLRGVIPRPVAELRTLRIKRHVLSDGGDDLAEVAEDDVRVVDGSRVVMRFREIEIELTEKAADDTLGTLEHLLRSEGAGPPDPTPKNVRALGPRAGEPEIPVPEIGPRSTIGEVLRAALAGSAERFVRYDAALRLRADEEAVHQARVAIRRMRSDLRTFAPILDRAWADAVREKMRWVSDVLADARDADVLLTRLEHDGAELPDPDRRRIGEVLGPVRTERDAAYRRIGAMLRDPQYLEVLETIVEAARAPVLAEQAARPARELGGMVLANAWKKLRKAIRNRIRPPSDRELHRIRIKAKRVRYAGEGLAPALGRRVRAFARRVEALQTILGDQHDAVNACGVLHHQAQSPQGFLAGALMHVENEAANAARSEWRSAWRKAKRCWQTLRV